MSNEAPCAKWEMRCVNKFTALARDFLSDKENAVRRKQNYVERHLTQYGGKSPSCVRSNEQYCEKLSIFSPSPLF